MAVKELTQITPINITGDGSDLLDWSITGAAGGVGKLGINLLKQTEKTINNESTEKNGNVIITFSTASNSPDIPSNEGHGADYKQWLDVSYDQYTLNAQNEKIYYDDRPIDYTHSQYKTQLPAGSYKLIFEAYSTRGTYNPDWRGTGLIRNGWNPNGNAEFHLFDDSDNALVDYTLVPNQHTGQRFIHEEFEFTLTQSTYLGLFFLRFGGVSKWRGRFQIVDADVEAEEFTIGLFSGVSCWEPYGYTLLLSVIGGGGITELKIPLGDTLLQEGSTISLFSTGIAIPTYYGETQYRVDSDVQPTMYIRFNEGTIVDMYAEQRPAMINVYGILEDQNNFTHNGIAVLMPFSCESYKEDKGRWDLTLTHPIDEYGKWTYIVGQNVLKVSGQLYRIDQTEVYSDADQEYIAAHAKHITYDLADRFIGETTFTVEDGTEYLAKLIYESGKLIPTQQPTHEYSFDLSSDLEGPMSADIHDQTVIGAIFGDDNSMCSRFAGEVYRSNFHISVNERMEGAPEDNAFSIRYGTDLTKISFRIDFSEWITELICEDNFGAVFGVSYVGSEWIIHHHKTKIVRFTYADMVNPGYDMERLIKDGQAYWETVSTPKVSIEVSVANIKTDPKYKDFLNLQNFDVGYKGTVYVEHLNIEVEMKIISIRRNELTGEIIAITLGNTRRSLIRSPVMSQTIVSANSATDKLAVSLQQQLIEMQTDLMASSINGMETFRITDLERRTINELEGN